MTIEMQAAELAASGATEGGVTDDLRAAAAVVQDRRNALNAALSARNALAREAVTDRGLAVAYVAAILGVSVSTVTKAVAEGGAL